MASTTNGQEKKYEFKDITYLESRTEVLNELRKQEKFTDFVLTSSDGISFNVHKLVLATSVPFFTGLFESKLKESEEGICKMESIPGERLLKIIDFIYTGRITLTIEDARDLYQDAKFLMLEGLSEFSTDVLIKEISLSTVLNVFTCAEANHITGLENHCIEFIGTNLSDLIAGKYLLELSETQFMKLISDEKLPHHESTNMEFALQWLSHDLKNRSSCIDFVISQMRFVVLCEHYLSKVLSNSVFRKNILFLETMVDFFKFGIDENNSTESTEQTTFKIPKFAMPRIGNTKTEIMAISNYKILFKTSHTFSPEHCVFNRLNAAATQFGTNFCLISGGDNSNICEYYCPIVNKVRAFPSMQESRWKHGVVTLKDKIYACGGFANNKTVEIFDIGRECWTKGKSMEKCEYDFGVTTTNNCIYAIGGSNTENKGAFERFDPRENIWHQLQHFEENSSPIKACAFESTLYAFNTKMGHQYDLRADKWFNKNISISIKRNPVDLLHFKEISALCEFDGVIYIVTCCCEHPSPCTCDHIVYLCEFNIKDAEWHSFLIKNYSKMRKVHSILPMRRCKSRC